MGNNLNGAEVLVNSLSEEKVEYVFGLAGVGIGGIFSSLYDHKDIELISTRHEQVAAGMADGYGRAKGRPGVCVVGGGPGTTNAIIGIANALRDYSPVVAFTGDQVFEELGRGIFHELDQMAMFKPITKWSTLLKTPEDIHRIVRTAFIRANTGRPGPIHINLHQDIIGREADPKLIEKQKPADSYISDFVRPDPKGVKKAASLILSSNNPVIIAGEGILWSDGSLKLLELAELLHIPVVVNALSRGVIPEDHALCLGLVGRWGLETARRAVREADLVLGIGCRFSDLTTVKWTLIKDEAKIVQVDIDPNEIGNQYPVDVGLVSSSRSFIEELIDDLVKHGIRDGSKFRDSSLIKALQQERKEELDALFGASNNESPIRRGQLVKEIRETLDRNALIFLGGGLHADYATNMLAYEPKTIFKSAGFGAMGMPFPQALGGKLACPDRQVVAIDGDGSFAMVSQDLETAVRHHIGAVVIVCNDYSFASIKSSQPKGRNIGVDYSNPDFAKLAELYGAQGARVEKPEEIGPALKRLLDSGEPGVLDVIVEPLEPSPTRWDYRNRSAILRDLKS